MILTEYWKAIIERCQKLKLRNQTQALKKIQGIDFETISMKARDSLIHNSILAWEEKYLINVKKFNQELKTSKDYRKNVCGRLLKSKTDKFMLFHRSKE